MKAASDGAGMGRGALPEIVVPGRGSTIEVFDMSVNLR